MVFGNRPATQGLLAMLQAIAPMLLATGVFAQTIPDVPPLLADQWIGSDDAPVTVVAYVSPNCAPCSTFQSDALPAIRSKYIDTGKVRVSIRDFPTNAIAAQAATLARCAGNRRERVLAQLYADNRQWAFETRPDRAMESAGRAGMEREEMERCLKDQRLVEALQKGKDMAVAGPQAVTVPFFYVNGVKYQDSLPGDAIDKALASRPPYEQSKKWCLEGDGSPGPIIRGCSALIAAAREPADAMARIRVRRAIAFIEKQDLDRGVEDLNAAIPLDPKSTEALWRRGMLKVGTRDFAGALDDFNRALRVNPNSAESNFGRGLVFSEQNDYAKAIAAFDQAVRLAPNYADALIYRGQAYAMLKQPDRALADYDQAIRAQPGNAVALHRRAVAYVQRGQTDKALADLAEALRNNPRMMAAYALRSMIRGNQGAYAEAVQDLDRLLLLEVAEPEWFLNQRCWYKAVGGRVEAALPDCDAAVSARPSEAAFVDSRGFVNLKLKRYDAAIADYDAALKLKSGLASSLFGRGVAKRAMGDAAGGDADLAAARKADAGVDKEMARYGVEP